MQSMAAGHGRCSTSQPHRIGVSPPNHCIPYCMSSSVGRGGHCQLQITLCCICQSAALPIHATANDPCAASPACSACAPQVVLWEGGAGAARLFGGDADTEAAVAAYCRALVAGLLPQVWAVVLAKHLQAQSRMALPAAVYLGGVLFNMGSTYMLVYREGMGLMGVPVAASLTRMVMCVAMLVVVVWVEASEVRRGASCSICGCISISSCICGCIG